MFILGTANFGNVYSGSKSFVDQSAASEIVQEFYQLGGRVIDTAPSYGESSEIVSKLLGSDGQVGTKININTLSNPSELAIFLEDTNNLFGDRLVYILLHDVEGLESVPDKSHLLLNEFLRENDNILFGVSIYYEEELELAQKKIECVRLVQAPFNFFDRRFIARRFVDKCRESGIEINYRSIFLQGKLLQTYGEINPFFHTFPQFQKYWEYATSGQHESLLHFNLDLILRDVLPNQLVIGCENGEQVREIGRLMQKPTQTDFSLFIQPEFVEDLALPMRWRLI